MLTDTECDKMMAPFRMLSKNKFGLARMVPNVIVHMKETYGLKNIHDNQLQAKIMNLCFKLMTKMN